MVRNSPSHNTFFAAAFLTLYMVLRFWVDHLKYQRLSGFEAVAQMPKAEALETGRVQCRGLAAALAAERLGGRESQRCDTCRGAEVGEGREVGERRWPREI